jgi:hypothetical protein
MERKTEKKRKEKKDDRMESSKRKGLLECPDHSLDCVVVLAGTNGDYRDPHPVHVPEQRCDLTFIVARKYPNIHLILCLWTVADTC